MSLISTLAPSRMNSSAVARPIPRAEPVTIAALPSSSPMFSRTPVFDCVKRCRGRAALYALGRHASATLVAPRCVAVRNGSPMVSESHTGRAYRGERAARAQEARIAAIAERQYGIVTRDQLLGEGFSGDSIDRRLAADRLHPVYRGVYAVGHRLLPTRGRWLAAVFAGGPGAVLSHRAAAALWDLAAIPAITDVTCRSHRRSRPGLRMHEAELPADEITVEQSIPVTTVARTAFDLAAVDDRHRLERTINEAERRALASPTSLAVLLDRHPARRGSVNLRAILAAGQIGRGVAASELELRFASFLDQRGFPRPEHNAPVEAAGRRFVADCLWRSQRLIAELDGHAFHADRESYEGDRARDRVLVAAGWRIVRVTWRQLQNEPDRLAADLRAALARATP
ncbi:MAG: DUF559 domain-containing protein [Solirubrobacterales bacterium]|nr:DUF559 domain-containing protein [Solirubrobacterales bacterium]